MYWNGLNLKMRNHHEIIVQHPLNTLRTERLSI